MVDGQPLWWRRLDELEQAGPTPDRGCADATFTLKTALQNLREHPTAKRMSHVTVFVDLVKAAGTVN
jgi:hypothetical protein